ncbi:MAG: alpha/beta hydrolase, partial [Bacteroidaceae bacterium]|nr:alpha/beta hydrolase [Bacteroidaceae bacterium]
LTPAARCSRAEYAERAKERFPAYAGWLDSVMQHEVLVDTFLTRSDGVRLHAYLLPAARPSGRTAITVHGYKDNALKYFPLAYIYHHLLGYNVVMPDLYAHGLSEGDAIQMGWKDRLDVMRWGELAHDHFRSDTLVVHGISMGAATTMMLAGEPSLPSYYRAFVADCGYTSVWDEYTVQLRDEFGLPPFPVLYAASALCKWRYGWSFREASALEAVRRCPRPMFFIHGAADTFVPTTMVYTLYEAKPSPKDLWVVPSTPHARSLDNEPTQYRSNIIRFMEKM